MTEEQSTYPEKEASEAETELRKKQLEIIDLFGTVDFDPNYDYKAARRRKRGDELS
jgi:hypothetical protein